MTDRTPCATPEALVTYLYEECDPAERQSIAAHVAMCAACSAEVEALSDTRAHLASWSPPALPLGFQITRTESDQPAKVLDFAGHASRSSQSGGWWRQPMPAWAQAAAAVLIFAAGMSVNAFRSPGEQPIRVVEAPASQRAAVAAQTPADDLRVTREEFARLDARLRAMERADVSRASYTPSNYDGGLGAQLSALESRVSANESRNSKSVKEIFAAVNKLQGDIETNRLATEKINVLDDELQQHRQVLLRTSGLAVRTAFTGSGR